MELKTRLSKLQFCMWQAFKIKKHYGVYFAMVMGGVNQLSCD